jgi:glycosyltransferase involved in cell wall biosynthesis
MTIKKFIERGYEKSRKIKMYFHCSLQDTIGWDLKWLAHYYGISDKIIYDENLRPGVGPTYEQMNEIVNCFDAHLTLPNSEGWGLTILETATAGVPTITTKYSAAADWGKEALLFCKVAEYEHEPRTGLIKAIASTDDAVQQLRLLYNSPKMCEEYAKRGIKLGQKLEWKNACKQWEYLLDSIDVSVLLPDRYSQPNIIPPKGDQIQANKLALKYYPEG